MAKGLSKSIALLALLWLAGTPTTVGAQPLSPAPVAQLLADDAYYPALIGKIRTAQKSIDLVMYLWKISAGSSDSKPDVLIRALGETKRRGVAVRVILENSGYDEKLNRANREAANLLRQEGITAVFDSPAVTTHTKLAVIDQRFCFIGSHNLTQSALERNHEMSILLDDRRLAGELTAYTDRIATEEATSRPVLKAPRQSGRQSHRR